MREEQKTREIHRAKTSDRCPRTKPEEWFDLFVTADFPPTGGGQSMYFDLITRNYPGQRVVLTRGNTDKTSDPATPTGYALHRLRTRNWQMPIAFFLFTVFRLKWRSIRFIHCGQIRAAGWCCYLLNLFFGIPYGIHVYGGERAKFADRMAWKLLLKPVLKRASCIFAISRWTRNQWIEYGIAPEKIVVITPAVDLDQFFPLPDRDALREELDLANHKVIFSISRLEPHKGTDKLIEAMPAVLEQCPDALLVIGGDGRMRTQLEQSAKARRLDPYIRFTGIIAADELNKWYNAMDLFVMPSRLQQGSTSGAEGFGIVYLEANACERPVIGGRSGGTADAIEENVSGLLVDPESPAAIAAAIIQILQNPGLAKNLGEKGRLRAIEQFSSSKISRKFHDTATRFCARCQP